ncbi:MAG: hypothetical protein R2813_09555 [Flavobacteriales bacterium]
MRKLLTLILVFFVLASISAVAQDSHAQPTGDENRADKLFFDENYKEALKEYLIVLKSKPEDIKVNYNIGLCYLNSDYDKVKSIPFFEKITFYDEEAATVYFLMGKAYQSVHKFDRAIEMFNRFIETYAMGAEYSIEEAEIEIEYCENAYQLIKFPKGCLYENLGPAINGPFPDYFPFVTIDESFLVYTSKRDDGSVELPDGTFASNIYYSRVVDGEYAPAIHMPGADNDPSESEVIVGMSADGEQMLLMKGLESISGDIYEADFSDDHLENVKPLSDKINSKRAREIAATYGQDRNVIFFVSDREGGYGGTDIWIVKKLPNGQWAVPYNAGPGVNTERDEDFPNLSPDGQYLFFSSKGHFSMGGYDIFKAKWDPDSNTFLNPRNLGYPVNSVDDDMNYRESKTGRYGYISALRPEGYGDYDIYRLTITEIESEYTVLRGSIKSDANQVVNSSITVVDLKSGDLVGTYTPNQNSQRYVIIVEPGEFDVLVEAEGMQPVVFEVKILGKSSFQPEIVKDINMIPE